MALVTFTWTQKSSSFPFQDSCNLSATTAGWVGASGDQGAALGKARPAQGTGLDPGDQLHCIRTWRQIGTKPLSSPKLGADSALGMTLSSLKAAPTSTGRTGLLGPLYQLGIAGAQGAPALPPYREGWEHAV